MIDFRVGIFHIGEDFRLFFTKFRFRRLSRRFFSHCSRSSARFIASLLRLLIDWLLVVRLLTGRLRLAAIELLGLIELIGARELSASERLLELRRLATEDVRERELVDAVSLDRLVGELPAPVRRRLAVQPHYYVDLLFGELVFRTR